MSIAFNYFRGAERERERRAKLYPSMTESATGNILRHKVYRRSRGSKARDARSGAFRAREAKLLGGSR
jgi:hypothetical protein